MFDLINSLKAARLTAIVNAIDGAALPGELWLYAAPKPAVGAATGAVLQCVIAMLRPSGVVVDGTLTFAAAEGLRSAADPITWGRFVTGSGAVVADFDVSAAAGAGALKLNATTGSIGSRVQITSAVLTE